MYLYKTEKRRKLYVQTYDRLFSNMRQRQRNVLQHGVHLETGSERLK